MPRQSLKEKRKRTRKTNRGPRPEAIGPVERQTGETPEEAAERRQEENRQEEGEVVDAAEDAEQAREDAAAEAADRGD